MSDLFWGEKVQEAPKFNRPIKSYITIGLFCLGFFILVGLPLLVQSVLGAPKAVESVSSKIKSAPAKDILGASDKDDSSFSDYYRQVLNETKILEKTQPAQPGLSASPGLVSSVATINVEQCYKDRSNGLSYAKSAYDLALTEENKRNALLIGDKMPTVDQLSVHNNNLKKILSEYEKTIEQIKSQYNCTSSD